MLLNHLFLVGKYDVRVVTASFPIIFFRIDDNGYRWTWRGVGQSCPNKGKIVGIGDVYIGENGNPNCVELSQHFECFDRAYIEVHWGDQNLFESHQLLYIERNSRAILFKYA